MEVSGQLRLPSSLHLFTGQIEAHRQDGTIPTLSTLLGASEAVTFKDTPVTCISSVRRESVYLLL